MRKYFSKKWAAPLLALILLFLICLLTAYLRHMHSAIQGMTISTIDQLAEHDMNSVELEIENSWMQLDGVYARVRASKPQTIQEVCNVLNREPAAGIFSNIYLVTDGGITYSAANIVMDSSDSSFIQNLLAGQPKIAVNEITGYRLEAEMETIAYGVNGRPFTVEDATFIGIFGFAPVKQLENRLNIRSFGGQGLSSVFDEQGYFVVNSDRSAGMKNRDNYFEQLQSRFELSDDEISELTKRFSANEEFHQIYHSSSSPEQIVYYIPLSNIGWTFCTAVPTSIVSQEAQPFIRTTIIAVVLLLILMTALLTTILYILSVSIKASAAARARGDFLSSMSHEMRTPLNAIIGLNELMQRNFDDPDKLRDYLHKSGSTAKYLLSLINDVLDMSKIQAGKADIVSAPLSLSYVLSTLESIIRGRMEEKQISFVVESDIKQDVIISDETHLEQILMNILGNASKFTDNHGHVSLRVSQSEPKNGSITTTFEVEDDGCGMSEEFQKRIFDSFSQEHRMARRSIEGTGLGMALSSRFAKAMGGQLSVQSSPGQGSLFTFVLPAKLSEDTVPKTLPEDASDIHASFAETEPAVQEDNAPLHILIAEDNELNVEILQELLAMEGFTTAHAPDGGAVVDIFAASEPFTFDLILMDIQMPVHNGYEAAALIRHLDRPDAKSVPIFACTANTFKEDQDKAYTSGMNDFIAKPIDATKLLAKINLISKGGSKQ